MLCNCQHISDLICSLNLNDLFRAEYKDQLNQISHQDILLQQHYVDIDTCRIKLEERKEKVQKCEDALEEKWNESLNKIDEQKKQMTSNSKVSVNKTKIDNEI